SSHTPTLPTEAIQKRLRQCSKATAKPIQVYSEDKPSSKFQVSTFYQQSFLFSKA
ncbi:12161_t:CDS:1, partial [Gigaspora rosea]